MDVAYPVGPTSVPDNLTAPSRNYRRQAWLAMGGLLLFVVVYFALAGWFAWTAWRLWSELLHANGNGVFGHFVGGASAAFLAIFMLKALVFVTRGEAVEDLEITPSQQPALFAFLHRLADDAGAPRPHRVFLSGRVNAGVFYDLSLANLLIPSRKNLEIGLALVNVLNLGELKAVLAHEFGHFAQRTMAVGRWVYIAQQVAAHIVARRDSFDAFLARLSRFDPRIAWIAWVLRVIIWSIRSLTDLLFRIVVLAQRALSREMEFQADLVAVSTTGSDALVHALHKLSAADNAWTQTLNFATSEVREGRGSTADLFAVQTRIIERIRIVLGDPDYGVAPTVAEDPSAHRLFKASLAAPPKMWSTHPTNSDREDNAKRTYVAAAIDERSAWVLFQDAEALRAQVSAKATPQTNTTAPLEETLKRVDQHYTRGYLDPVYRGAFLGRSIVRHARTVDELYTEQPASFDTLYPESLTKQLERLRELHEEKNLLAALRAGLLTAPGGIIRHRGEQVSRKALPHVIEAVQRELEACEQVVRDHDRRCRTTYLSAAAELGPSWADYLKGLLQLLHYADHVEANLMDAYDLLGHTLSVATAKGARGNKQRDQVLHVSDTTYAAIRDIHDAIDKVIPDRTVLHRMKVPSWRAAVEELQLPPPDAANLVQWIGAVESWILSTAKSLTNLRLATLDQLLAVESQVARFTSMGMKPAAAPPASKVPKDYRLLIPGTERPRMTLNWWERFQTGSGILPTAVRVAAAAAIIGAVIMIGSSVRY